jgi:general secretion pathway protein C
VLTNQGEIMRAARVIPHEEGGRVVGLKLYGVRRGSLLSRIGLSNGDTLRTINGYSMSSLDDGIAAFANLRNADHLTVALVRGGSATNINYSIR